MSNYHKPLSPHLQVYKPQLTSMLSILHRATGCFLILGFLYLSWGLGALWSGKQCFSGFLSLSHSFLGSVFLFVMVGSFFYHLLNGVRHLFWDLGKGYSLKIAYITGWAVLTAAFLCSGLTLVFGGFFS